MRNKPFLRPAIGTGLILLVPLVMTIHDRDKPAGDGWHWEPASFLVMGALLFGAGLAYELIASRLGSALHRAVLGAGIFLVVFAIWVELAVDGVSQLIGYLWG